MAIKMGLLLVVGELGQKRYKLTTTAVWLGNSEKLSF